MKRISISFFILILLCAAGCTKNKETETARFTVISSFYPVYIIAKNVSHNVPGVTIRNLTPPMTGCLHDYSVTADDMKKLETADLLIINGAGMESFMQTVIGRYPSLRTAALSKGIPTIKENHLENPHLWVSLSTYAEMIKNCTDALCAADPVYEKQYRASGDTYLKKVYALKKELDAKLRPYKGRQIITFHEAFPYFAREYGLRIAAVIEREPGTEPSAKELAETIELVKKSKIKILFTEPQYPSASAEVIAKESGAKILVLDPIVTGPDDNDAYLSIMRSNGEVLQKAFSQE